MILKFQFVKIKSFNYFPTKNSSLSKKSIISPNLLPKANSLFPKIHEIPLFFFSYCTISIITMQIQPKKEYHQGFFWNLLQYYKGKTIIIVAPFANIWESPIINDKKEGEHSCIEIKSFRVLIMDIIIQSCTIFLLI